LNRFFAELKRRRVMRVVGVYAVAAWAAVQVADTVSPLIRLPDWTPTLVVVLALCGFPLTVALAWVFDLTPAGVRRTVGADEVVEEEATNAVVARPTLQSRAVGFFGLGILVALVAFAAYSRIRPFPSAAGIQSIAVLPFVDMSEARDQEYFSDGVTEELLNRLAQIEGLRVPARTSSFAFKGKNEPVTEIGRKLGVEAVLEGSVRRDGNRVRVTAQLIDVNTGFHLWSENYDRDVEGIFTIQDEISNAIVEALKMQFSPAAEENAGTGNVRAHDLYLLGLSRWHHRTDASLRQALDYFQRAIAADPDYALAHAGLAQTYAVLPAVGPFPFVEAVTKGSAAAARAVSLDPALAEAHAALGQMAQNFEWELADAERAYRRAISFDDRYAPAHQWYAETLIAMGRLNDARAQIDEAIDQDPLSPAALSVRAYLLLVRGDSTAAALAAFRTLTAANPDYALGQLNLLLASLYSGDYAGAAAAAPRVTPDTAAAAAMASIARGLADTRGREAATRAMERLDSMLPPSLAGLWFAALGDTARALDRIQQAFDEHADANFPLILAHPLLRPLHDDPRFQDIANSVGAKPVALSMSR
jgi:TolB-like protein/Tfp pilus assembly protein PilF